MLDMLKAPDIGRSINTGSDLDTTGYRIRPIQRVSCISRMKNSVSLFFIDLVAASADVFYLLIRWGLASGSLLGCKKTGTV